MVHIAADLAQFVQRRELLAYEQRLARAAYAYGVDLRRSSWLDHSSVGEALMRAVDRRWNGLLDDLHTHHVHPAGEAVPDVIMEEIVSIVRLIRAPVPTLRLLRAPPTEAWPSVLPLGTTRGGAHLLVLDVEALLQRTSAQRTFSLAAGLGHLQCDHGPLFAAHLMAHRGRGLGFVRTLMRPWARVAVFSADRAGLLATADLEASVDAIGIAGREAPPWAPYAPPADVREAALRDFDRSRVATRLRLLRENKVVDAQLVPAAERDPRGEGKDVDPVQAAEAAPPPEEPDTSSPPQEVEQILASAWSLARCDSRLTRRLGIL